MPRIAYPLNASALPDIQPSGARTLNVERMLMHLPERVREDFGRFGKSMLWGGTLDPALRELALVRVGRLSNAAYETYHHEALARTVGVSEDKLEALKALNPAGPFGAAETALLSFTDDIIRNVRPSDQNLADVQQHLSSTEIMELVMVIGLYMTISRVLETFGVELDDFALNNVPRT